MEAGSESGVKSFALALHPLHECFEARVATEPLEKRIELREKWVIDETLDPPRSPANPTRARLAVPARQHSLRSMPTWDLDEMSSPLRLLPMMDCLRVPIDGEPEHASHIGRRIVPLSRHALEKQRPRAIQLLVPRQHQGMEHDKHG